MTGSNLRRAAAGAAGGAAGYAVDYSCRFDGTSDYLKFTPDAGNRKKWTVSVWVKRSDIDRQQTIWTAGAWSGSCWSLHFEANEHLKFEDYTGGAHSLNLETSAVFRDPHAWMHVVIKYDSDTEDTPSATTNGMYINGVQVTDFITTPTYPAADELTTWNNNVQHTLGYVAGDGTRYFDGYVAEFVHIEDQSLAATSFGEFDDNGVWRPIDVSELTFGNNGFYLDFAVPTGTGNGAGTDVHLSGVTTKTTSGAGDWTGDTGDFATLVTDVVATGGNTGAIYVSERTFTGDFAVEFIWYAGASPAYMGGFATAEIGDHWSSTAALGGVNLMDDSIYLHFDASNDVDAYAAGSLDTVGGATIFQVVYHNRETIKFQREGDTFKVFEDGVERYEWTAKSTATYTVWLGQASSSMDWENFRWTDGSTSFLNHFTDSGLAVNDRVPDSPTNNYATLSPLGPRNLTLRDGNLELYTAGDANYWNTPASISFDVTDSAGYYVEFKNVAGSVGYHVWGIGKVQNLSTTGTPNLSERILTAGSGGGQAFACVLSAGGNISNGSGGYTAATGGSSVAAGAYLGMMVKSGKIWINTSGGWWSGDPDADTSPTYTGLTGQYTFIVGYESSGAATSGINFGQFAFSNTPPTTYKKLMTTDLPVPAIKDPSGHHQVALVDHGGTSTAVTCNWNMNTYDTMVIIKNRDNTEKWYVIDGVTGYNKYSSYNATAATGQTDANVFAVSGVTGTLGSTLLADNYIVEFFKAGLSASRDTDNSEGSLTGASNSLIISANTTGGFSIVTWVGTAANATFGHGLNAAYEYGQFKNLTDATNTKVYHVSAGPTKSSYTNSAVAFVSSSTDFNNATVTATVGGVGTSADTNGSGDAQVAYLWTPISGYSHMAQYTGNINANGPLIIAGIKPATSMQHGIDSSTPSWHQRYMEADIYNQATEELLLDTTGAENSSFPVDVISNGIKIRNAEGQMNESGGDFAYVVWGAPFGGNGGTFGAGVAPATAR